MNPIDVSASAGVSRSCSPPSARGLRSLSGLSNRELLSRVKDLVARERAVTLEILLHLIEVERRRLHVGLGYASMFDYCTRHLGYSSSSAARRIHTARCLRDYADVYRLLEKNEVNLSTVSLISSILTRENHKDILERIRGKSQKEVEGIVADYRPPVSLRDRAKPVCVAVASSTAPGTSTFAMPGTLAASMPNGNPASSAIAERWDDGRTPTRTQWTSRCDYSRCGSEKRPNSVGGPPRLERRFQVQFLASERFMEKFEKARALLSNRIGNLSYEAVLEAALDEFLKDHDPEQRKQRREERKEKADDPSCECDRAGGGQADGPLFRRRAGGLPSTRVVADRGVSRRIPAAVRDAVFARDKGRCTYVGSNGERCAATHHLQIDHVIPCARGGTNAASNLRLLCERHNKREAERVLGPNVTGKFRARE